MGWTSTTSAILLLPLEKLGGLAPKEPYKEGDTPRTSLPDATWPAWKERTSSERERRAGAELLRAQGGNRGPGL